MVRRRCAVSAGTALALACVALAVTGCSSALPLGPAASPAPAPSRLASAIVMQPGVSDPGAPVSKCPAGTVALSGPGAINAPSGGTSPVSSPSGPSGVCFRTLGKPLTFTSAAVDVYEQPAGSQPVQHPASWQVQVYLPAAEATELEAVTTKLADTQDQLAIIIGGQTWGMPLTFQPLTGGEFGIAAESKNEALQIQRLLQ